MTKFSAKKRISVVVCANKVHHQQDQISRLMSCAQFGLIAAD